MTEKNTNTESTGKGHATPKRKDSELSRKQTLKVPTDKKAAKAAMRQRENSARLETRKALYTGEQKHLPLRDQGAVRQFVRNHVDRRISVGEMFVPVAFSVLLLAIAFATNEFVQSLVSSVWSVMLIGLLADAIILSITLRKKLKVEFPDYKARGDVLYAVMRSITLRTMRLPKPLVKIGGAPRVNKLPKALR
ncbi:MAG: hypothetical protein RLZZ426_210 [Actinomycetota bacterium]|jgi:hypothetical protein